MSTFGLRGIFCLPRTNSSVLGCDLAEKSFDLWSFSFLEHGESKLSDGDANFCLSCVFKFFLWSSTAFLFRYVFLNTCRWRQCFAHVFVLCATLRLIFKCWLKESRFSSLLVQDTDVFWIFLINFVTISWDADPPYDIANLLLFFSAMM